LLQGEDLTGKEARGTKSSPRQRVGYSLDMAGDDSAAALQEAEDHLTAGRFDLAEALCVSRLAADPRQTPFLILLSFVRMKQGRWSEAETILVGGCALHPTDVGLRATLGNLYVLQGRLGDAVEPLQTCVLLEPGRRDHRVALVAVYEKRSFTSFSESAKQAMLACLADDALTHGLMTRAWLSLLRLDPQSAGVLRLFGASGYEVFRDQVTPELLFDWQGNELLNGGLTRFLVPDPTIERGLTHTRRWFFERWSQQGAPALERHLPLLCTLARACFFDEYVLETSEDHSPLSRSLATPAEVALLGCYEPLHPHEHSRRLASLSDRQCYRDLTRIQIEEPLKELRIKTTIATASSPIADEVSRAVREQYEESPYPRWATVGGTTIPDEVAAGAKGKSILLAGCGTGREAVECALIFPAARIEAVDLSRTSLAYGIRKARERRTRNLAFTQCDILGIGRLGKTFDLIVCSGVLHHMADPIAGLRALLTVLRPGGLMKLGLYSTLARATIAEARAWIATAGFTSNIQGIRAFRAAVLARADDDPIKRRVTAWEDFYSASACRDMLFHVKEHTFTLPQIAEAFHGLELSVLRVDVRNPKDALAYRDRFPDDPDATDLRNWHALERERPTMFAGMYSLWVCRAAERREIDVAWVFETRRM
jgi:ubiquinone/menaquinone biosynthesis C-methylase UbiE